MLPQSHAIFEASESQPEALDANPLFGNIY